MEDMLNVVGETENLEGVVRSEYHSYQPFTHAFGNNDEIRIIINQQDVYTLPHDSYIYIEGVVEKTAGGGATTSHLSNNCLAFLFSEVRYEVNGVEVDATKNVGITSALKLYPSFGSEESKPLKLAGWSPEGTNAWMKHTDGYFVGILPLKNILGFAEDHKRIMLNVRQELILVRDRSDYNALLADATTPVESKITLQRILWRVPHVNVSDREKLRLLKIVENDTPVPLRFRSWELHEYPELPTTAKHTWAVKTSRFTEKPLYVIVGFQTDRKFQHAKDASEFDHCNLRNIRLYLNGVTYPYEAMDIDFSKNKFGLLYDMFCKFQNSYYQKSNCPVFTPEEYKQTSPIVVMDCSYQEEAMKQGPVDIRLDFESTENIPAKTTAYCLIIHESAAIYHPLSNIVTRL